MSPLVVFMLLALVFAKAQDIDPFCPDPTSILPCTCESLEEIPLVYCYNLTSENELESIFSVSYPVTDIFSIQIWYSTITELSRNVFGNCTFEIIEILRSDLQSVSEEAFQNSETTLRTLTISECPVTSRTFPFNSLTNYVALEQIQFFATQITSFPEIINDSLLRFFIQNNDLLTLVPDGILGGTPNVQILDLTRSGVETIEADALNGADDMITIFLDYNNIQALPASVFRNLPLQNIYCSYNNISAIEIGTFNSLSGLEYLSLYANNIETLDVSTFAGNGALDTLVLEYNVIGTIESGTFANNNAMRKLAMRNNVITSLVAGAFSGLTDIQLQLDGNLISNIEPDSFGDIADSDIGLGNNLLSELDETWMRPLLDNNNMIYINENPFTCGCEILWVFDDPTYQFNINGQCPDGTFIADLDPFDYIDVCVK